MHSESLRCRCRPRPRDAARFVVKRLPGQLPILGLSDAPLSSSSAGGVVEASSFVFPHASDGSFGDVSLVGAAGFASGLALAELADDVHACVEPAALLGDAGQIEDAVDGRLPLEVEPMLDR